MTGNKQPLVLFAALCGVAALLIAGAIYFSKARGLSAAGVGGITGTRVAADWAGPQSSAGSNRIYFRYTGLDADYGKLAHVEYGEPASATAVDQLTCEVVHASGGRGICLAADRGVVTTYAAKLFGTDDHAVFAEVALAGVPSRTRVSTNGRLGAVTVFVSGHGYASVDFSTQTTLLDLQAGTVIGDVEEFEFTSNGAVIREADFNVWGVTFMPDGDTFFATLSTQMRHLLVQGSARQRTAKVVYEDVECPSVSPDGKRVAYKQRFVKDGFAAWHLHVLDLATMTNIQLAEDRSVDDQLEWLDDGRVLYSVPDGEASAGSDVWVIAADGTGAPARFLQHAYSPAVAR